MDRLAALKVGLFFKLIEFIALAERNSQPFWFLASEEAS
jgi:hypothetical protein